MESRSPADSFISSSVKSYDANSLTSFNPFSEEDEAAESSYTLVTSLFSRMRNTLSSATPSITTSSTAAPTIVSHSTSKLAPEHRSTGLAIRSSKRAAPPLVSVTAVVSEAPSFHQDLSMRSGQNTPTMLETPDGGIFGTSIPGFPIQDDARSIRTSHSLGRSSSDVSKVMRRIRGEGMSRCGY